MFLAPLASSLSFRSICYIVITIERYTVIATERYTVISSERSESRNLLRSEDPVAGVTQTRKDVVPVVQTIVY